MPIGKLEIIAALCDLLLQYRKVKSTSYAPSLVPSVSLKDAVVVNVELGAVVVLSTFTKKIRLYVRGVDTRRISIVTICITMHNTNTSF